MRFSLCSPICSIFTIIHLIWTRTPPLSSHPQTTPNPIHIDLSFLHLFLSFTVVRMLPGHAMPWAALGLAWHGMACQAWGPSVLYSIYPYREQSRTSLVKHSHQRPVFFLTHSRSKLPSLDSKTGTRGYVKGSDTLLAFVLLHPLNVLCFFSVTFSFFFLAMFFPVNTEAESAGKVLKRSKTRLLTQFFYN